MKEDLFLQKKLRRNYLLKFLLFAIIQVFEKVNGFK